ncbi:MAG: hypothetical protein M1836_003214 [Candelina mexicana]|nr:MAG: hypothetical protein M1836_003214 [Candelina mexicana]
MKSGTPSDIGPVVQYNDARKLEKSPACMSCGRCTLSAMTEDSTTSAALGTEMDTSKSSTKLDHRAIHAEEDILLQHESETPHRTSAAYTGRPWLREESKDTPLTSDSSRCFKQFDDFCVGYSGSKSVKSFAKRILTEWLGVPIDVPKSARTRDTKTTSDAISSGKSHKVRDIVGHFNISTERIWFQYGPGIYGTIPASIGSTPCPVIFKTVVSKIQVALTPTTMTMIYCPDSISQEIDRTLPEPRPASRYRSQYPTERDSSIHKSECEHTILPALTANTSCPVSSSTLSLEGEVDSTSPTLSVAFCPTVLSCPVPPDTFEYVWKDSYSGGVVSMTKIMEIPYCPARITQTIDRRIPEATHSSTKMDNNSSAELSLLYAGPGGVSHLPASQGSVICPTPFDIVTLETSIESTSTTVTISLCPVYQTVTRRAFEPTPTNLERRKIPQPEARNTKEHKTFDRMPVPLREFFGCLGDEHKQPWGCSVIITQFRTWIKSDNGQEACRGYGVITGKLEDKPRPWKDLLCRLDKYEIQTYAEASAPGNSSIAKESSLELLDDSITSFEYWLQTPRGFSDFNAYKKDMVHKINSGKVPIYVEHHNGHQVSSVLSGCTPTESITSATASATSAVRNRFLAARDSILQPAKSLTPRNILHPNEKQIKKCKADANKPLYRKRGIPLVPNLLVANLILQPRATTGPVPAVEALLVQDPLGAHCSMIGYREHLMLLLVCLVFLILCALGFVMWYLRRLNRHHHRAQTPEPTSSRERARSIVTVRDPNTFNDIVIPEEDPSRLPSNPQTRNKCLPLPKNGLANWGEKFKRARAEDPENVPPRARIPSAWKNGTARDESIPLKQRLPLGENQVNDRGGEADKPRVVSTGTDRKEPGGSVVNRKGSSQGYGSV